MNYESIKNFLTEDGGIDCLKIIENNNVLTFILKYNLEKNINISDNLLSKIILASDLSFIDENENNALNLYLMNKKDQNIPNFSQELQEYFLINSDKQQLNNKKRNALILALINNSSQELNLTTDVFSYLTIWSDLKLLDTYNSSAAHYLIYYFEKEKLEFLPSSVINMIISQSKNTKLNDDYDLYDLLLQSPNKESICYNITAKTLEKIAKTKIRKLSIKYLNLKKICNKNLIDKNITTTIVGNMSYNKSKSVDKVEEEILNKEEDILETENVSYIKDSTNSILEYEENKNEVEIKKITFDKKTLIYILNFLEKNLEQEEISQTIEKIKKGILIIKNQETTDFFNKYLEDKRVYFSELTAHYTQIKTYCENFDNKDYLEQACKMIQESLTKFEKEIENMIFDLTQNSLSSMKILTNSFLKD